MSLLVLEEVAALLARRDLGTVPKLVGAALVLLHESAVGPFTATAVAGAAGLRLGETAVGLALLGDAGWVRIEPVCRRDGEPVDAADEHVYAWLGVVAEGTARGAHR